VHAAIEELKDYVKHTYVVGEDDAPFPDLILPIKVRQAEKNIAE
jgi:hypothetical protein